MRITCTHCRDPIEVVDDESLAEIVCPSCGCNFSLATTEEPSTEAVRRHLEASTGTRRIFARLPAILLLLLIAIALTLIARTLQSPAAPAPESLSEEATQAKRQAWEAWCKAGEVTNSIGMKLVVIPAGEFSMGCPDDPRQLFDWARQMSPGYPYKFEWFAGETPQHQVRISKPFAMGVFEVTKGQFAEFVAAAGYQTDMEKERAGLRGWLRTSAQQAKLSWRDAGFDDTDAHPVVNVSWNDAVAFCQWLTRRESRTYRLPTEAEWEYACRAGTTARYSRGEDPEGLVEVGNVRDRTFHEQFVSSEHCLTSADGYAFTAPVGRFHANGFGLHDMLGNAGEWCSDWYSEEYFAQSPADDPQGPRMGSVRVFRGGSWTRRAVGCRVTSRRSGEPTYRNNDVGFRVVCGP
jgi:formylglycine-generating enzyme